MFCFWGWRFGGTCFNNLHFKLLRGVAFLTFFWLVTASMVFGNHPNFSHLIQWGDDGTQHLVGPVREAKVFWRSVVFTEGDGFRETFFFFLLLLLLHFFNICKGHLSLGETTTLIQLQGFGVRLGHHVCLVWRFDPLGHLFSFLIEVRIHPPKMTCFWHSEQKTGTTHQRSTGERKSFILLQRWSATVVS